jgi:hypothetical protein
VGRLRIRGYSDDIVSTSGDIGCEINAGGGEGYVAVSDGTILRFDFADGIWRFGVHWPGTRATIHIEPYRGEPDGSVHSDEVNLHDPDDVFSWVAGPSVGFNLDVRPRNAGS